MAATAMRAVGRRARRARREILVSACFASSAFLFLAFMGSATARAQQQALTPVTDQAAVDRGKALLVEQCGFCHGANARGGSGPPSGPLYMEPTAITVTVTLSSGESASGGLVRLTDFDVILYDGAAGRVRSFL